MQEKSPLELTDKFFFENSDFDLDKVQSLLSNTLIDADDGELYLESTKSESFSFDDGRMKNISYDSTKGFGLRAIAGEARGFAHSGEITEYQVFSSIIILSPPPIPRAPPEAPSPITTTII